MVKKYLLFLALTVLSTTTTTQAAVAQAATTPTIAITALPTWFTTTSDATISVHLTNSDAVKMLRLQISARLTSSDQLVQWVNAGQPRNIIRSISQDFPPTPDGSANLVIAKDDRVHAQMQNAGTYPISLDALSSTGAALASARSFLITQPTVATNRLDVALSIPFFSGALIKPDTSDILNADETDRVSKTLAVLSAHNATPFALRLFGDTAHALNNPDNPSAIKSSLLALSTSHPIIGDQWGPIANESSNASALAQQRDLTNSEIRTLIGREPDISALQTGREVPRASYDAAKTAVTHLLIAPDTSLASKKAGGVESKLALPSMPATALPYDRATADFLAQNSLAGVQNSLAAITTRYLARSTSSRHIVLSPPTTSLLDATLLDAWLKAIEASPFLQIEPIANQIALVPTPATITLQPIANLDKKSQSIHDLAISDLEDFDSIVLPNNQLAQDLHASFQTGNTNWISNSDRAGYWQRVRNTIGAEFAKIVPPQKESLRLTAQRITLPITVRSSTNYPVKIQLDLESSRIEFLSGPSQVITIDRASRTTKFEIRARASGSFPIRIALRSPTRKIVLAQSEIDANAFGTTNVGAYLSIAALVVLIAWWGQYVWRRRREIYNPSAT